jgi:hypothetical protein
MTPQRQQQQDSTQLSASGMTGHDSMIQSATELCNSTGQA